MTKRKIISILLAAMMLTVLSGCEEIEDSSNVTSDVSQSADLDSKDDEKDDTVPDSSAEDHDRIDDDADSDSRSDYEAAEAVLEQFLDALCSGDRDALYSCTTVSLYYDLLIMEYEFEAEEKVSEADKDAYREQVLYEMLSDQDLEEADTLLESYEIGDGALRGDCVQAYEATLEDQRMEIIAEHNETGDEAAYTLSLQLLDAFPKIEKVYIFPVTLTAEGDSAEWEFTVICENDTWSVDLLFVPEVIGYAQRVLCTTANTSAKSVEQAVNFALTDMDAEGMPISLLCGKTYYFKEGDFEGVTKPDSVTTAEEALQALKYQITLYFDSADRLEQFAIMIDESGSCAAVAVQSGTVFTAEAGEIPIYGMYPRGLTVDEQSASLTLDAVLTYACSIQ